MSAPKAPPIEGVEALDPESLRGTDFARFRNDELYFIEYVMFYRNTAGSSVASKPEQRVLALTPFALFITDLDGTMDRATRYEDINDILHQRKVNKKLFGSETHMHYVLKVPREIDWHISFDISKGDAHSKKFTEVLGAVWASKKHLGEDEEGDEPLAASPSGEKKKKKKSKLRFTEVEASVDICTKINSDAAEDYVPPEEIKRRNREQQQMLDRIDEVSGEIVNLQKQIEDARGSFMIRQEELKELEGKYGVELSELRTQKLALQKRQVAMHKQITNGEIELVKLQADVARFREQLDEERTNYNSLVEKRLSSAGDEVSQKQHEMMSLRQKAQQKELSKTVAKAQSLKEEVSVKPRYEGPPALVQKAEALEHKIDEAIELWTKDMEASNKIEKFLDAINAEVTRLSNQISEKNEEKQALIDRREQEALQQQQQQQRRDSGTSDLLGDDDLPPVPNQSVTAMPSSTRSLPDGDTDLLASLSPEIPKSVASGALVGEDPLDDLLDDGPTVNVKPATKEATKPVVDDDLF